MFNGAIILYLRKKEAINHLTCFFPPKKHKIYFTDIIKQTINEFAEYFNEFNDLYGVFTQYSI